MIINPSTIDSVISVKEGDTMRILYDQLALSSTPINLSSSSVYLVIHDPSTNTTLSRSATISSDISGSVQYQLTSDDIGTTGSKLAEWKIINQDGKILYVPTNGYIYLEIVDNL